MSSSNYINSVAIFQGDQWQFYVIDGIKYHIQFPLHWAIDHKKVTGPKLCQNCECYGAFQGVFIGYCSNCLRDYKDWKCERGHIHVPGSVIDQLTNHQIWSQYPYMEGIYLKQEPSKHSGEEKVVEHVAEDVEDNASLYSYCNYSEDEAPYISSTSDDESYEPEINLNYKDLPPNPDDLPWNW